MRIFTSREFTRFARKNRIGDSDLCNAIAEIVAGKADANLGGGVYKQRIARQGQGKSGGFRTIVLLRHGTLAVFAYGFAKNDRANITAAELEAWRRIAKDLLVDRSAVQLAIEQGKLIEVTCHEEPIP